LSNPEREQRGQIIMIILDKWKPLVLKITNKLVPSTVPAQKIVPATKYLRFFDGVA
jgi:hypothetical protein